MNCNGSNLIDPQQSASMMNAMPTPKAVKPSDNQIQRGEEIKN
jgi:hypothetical protein